MIRYIGHLDWDDGFHEYIEMSKYIKLNTLNICSLSCVCTQKGFAEIQPGQWLTCHVWYQTPNWDTSTFYTWNCNFHWDKKGLTTPLRSSLVKSVENSLLQITGEVIEGFPMTQWVKNLPAMQEIQEMQVWSLGWDDLLEESMTRAFPVFLPEESSGLRSLVGYSP